LAAVADRAQERDLNKLTTLYRAAVLWALLVVVAAGCGGRERLEQGPGLQGATPGTELPALSGLDAAAREQARKAAGLTETLIQGKFTLMRSLGAVDNGTALDLISSSGMEWGLYAFDPQGNTPDSLAVLLDVPAGNSAWVALADYSRGVWEWFGPLTGGKTLVIDEAKYTSPGGLLYCTVSSSDGDSATVSALSVRTINPQNVAPAADLQADVTSGNAPLTVSFDAGASTDSDGTIIEYAWDFDANGTYEEFSDVPQVQHVFSGPGIVDVKLRVTDEQFGRDTATLQINVTAVGNNPPVVDLQPMLFGGSAPLTVNFDASNTEAGDVGDSIVKYEWDWEGDGTYESYGDEPVIIHTYVSVGSFLTTLRVTDEAGNQAMEVALVLVNAAPVAVLELSPATVDVHETTIMNGSLSSDSNGSITQYEWDSDANGSFETNTGADSLLTGVSFGTPGIKTLKLRVTDNSGGTATASAVLRVNGWGVPQTPDDVTGRLTCLATVNGNPAISYWDASNSDLRYVRATNASGTAWGTPITVDGDGDTGYFPSLVIVNGNPAISYHDSGNDVLRYVRATDASGTAWGAPITVDTGDTGLNLSMAIVDGNPAISYYDATNGDLRYVRATDASGTAWDTPITVDSAGNTGSFTSLAVVNGNPAISYLDNGNGDLRYVRATDASGSAWGTPVTPDSAGFTGVDTSLAVVNGNPAISYQDVTNGDLRYVRASDASGGVWDTPVTPDSAGETGYYTSLAVVNGNPAISYYDYTNGNLRFVRALDASGSAWGTPATPDSTGDTGTESSLAVVNGSPAISYHEVTNGDLRYIRFEP